MDLEQFSQRLNQLDFTQVLNTAVLGREGEIIDYNQAQLLQGEDKTGTKIRTYKAITPEVYAPYTIALKNAKGQNSKAVTLKDTGMFYKSFEMETDPDGFNINADFEKDDGNIADNLDVTNVLGLNEQNQSKLNEILKADIQTLCRQALL